MLNVVVLIGRLVADPELRYTPNGVPVTSLRVAVDRRFRAGDSGEKQTDFFDVTVWNKSAEFAANYLTKGSLISIEGRLQQRTWVQQDGQKRSKVDVIANSIQGLDRRKDGVAGTSPKDVDITPPEMPGNDFEADMDYDPFADE